MKTNYEVIGHITGTLCKVVGGSFTVGAARDLANHYATHGVYQGRHMVGQAEFFAFEVIDAKGESHHHVFSKVET